LLKRFREEIATVYIGPCIDNKDEVYLYRDGKLVEGVLTFIELRQLFDEFDIQERVVTMSEFDPPYGNWGALYPLPAGILQAGGIRRDMAISSVITAAGREDVFEGINDFENTLIPSIIILTFSSAMVVFWAPEWNATPNVSEEERWCANMLKKGLVSWIRSSGERIWTSGRNLISQEPSTLMINVFRTLLLKLSMKY
jgi:hypothetical protein